MSEPGLARLEHWNEVASTLMMDDLVAWQRSALARSARDVRLAEAFAEATAELQDSSRLLQSARSARSRWFFKAVAKIGGRYMSIFDGQTEFKLGERIERVPAMGHRGAFFAYESIERAREASFPKSSQLLNADRVLLRVRGNAPHAETKRAHGKVMLWAMTPLEEVPLRASVAAVGRRRRAAPS